MHQTAQISVCTAHRLKEEVDTVTARKYKPLIASHIVERPANLCIVEKTALNQADGDCLCSKRAKLILKLL